VNRLALRTICKAHVQDRMIELFEIFRRLIFRSGGSAEGSLLVAIEHALDRVHEGSASDESMALAANKIVRKALDKRAISYSEYKIWRKRNRFIFTTVVDEANQLIGFFDIFPLTSEAGEAIVSGALTERSLKADHILPEGATREATHIHIATVLLNPRQKSFTPMVAKEVLLLKLKEFIEAKYDPVETRTFTAFAQSKSGEALQRCDFSMVVFSKDNEQHLPLYVLRPAESGTAVFRFNQAEKRFSSTRRRKAALTHLDSRIEEVELQLREAIAKALNGDTNLLPSHVTSKIEERLRGLAKKDAAADLARYRSLLARLEFCDVRELQDTILNSAIWPHFRARFINQETLFARFGKLAELRNAIRHSRPVDDIMQKDGEAAVLWFERVLSKPNTT